MYTRTYADITTIETNNLQNKLSETSAKVEKLQLQQLTFCKRRCCIAALCTDHLNSRNLHDTCIMLQKAQVCLMYREKETRVWN